MNLRDRLFDLRRQAGLSQEELANLLGVTRQAVQKWEAGLSRPDMDNLVSLANYFKVSLDFLVTGKEPSPPPSPAPTIVNNYYHEGPDRWHYEYKSKRTLFGLPLVHVNLGRNAWARGIVAIGSIATGAVALGGVAFGLFSLGCVSLGLLLALGAVSLGAVSIGGIAVGLLAWGGIAMGWLAIGGMSLGTYAAGGAAVASEVAVGGAAVAGQLAVGMDVDGAAKTILVPLEGLKGADLDAARAAIDAACAEAPGFVPWLLKLFLTP
ncbi:MAG: helix-turn-helix transcriptional regulator [Oscillospiraceae bacterium]|jgi:transcriptional regulator with XRE-family HTH domain|nr:helix-turn-helix transcriptional regulator [Oscillospiraceae bacterium]MCI9547811.1 helix-turn-helix transcriptional regulator [Oscillospiraceae bacterium]